MLSRKTPGTFGTVISKDLTKADFTTVPGVGMPRPGTSLRVPLGNWFSITQKQQVAIVCNKRTTEQGVPPCVDDDAGLRAEFGSAASCESYHRAGECDGVVNAPKPPADGTFSATLGLHMGQYKRWNDGVFPGGTYAFKKVRLASGAIPSPAPTKDTLVGKGSAARPSANYSSLMVAECKKYNMKPVCASSRGGLHKTYCDSQNSLWIGNTKQLGDKAAWGNTSSSFPSGWDSIKSNWAGPLCSYTGKEGNPTGKALCTTSSGRQTFKTPQEFEANPGFICGAREHFGAPRPPHPFAGKGRAPWRSAPTRLFVVNTLASNTVLFPGRPRV